MRIIKTLAVLIVIYATVAASEGPQPIFVKDASLFFDGQRFHTNVSVLIKTRSFSITNAAPNRALSINGKGKTLLPALYDRAVMLMNMNSAYDPVRDGIGEAAAQALAAYPGNRKSMLQSGILQADDLYSPVKPMRRLKGEAERREKAAPSFSFSGGVFSVRRGHPIKSTFKGRHKLIDAAVIRCGGRREDNALEYIDKLKEYEARYLHIIYHTNSKDLERMKAGTMGKLIKKAHSLGMKAAVSIEDAEGAAEALKAGADIIVNSFPFNEEAAHVIQMMRNKQTVFIPSLGAMIEQHPDKRDMLIKTVNVAYEAGLIIKAGSGFPYAGGLSAGDTFWQELQLLKEAGLSDEKLLKSACIDSSYGKRQNYIIYNADIRKGSLDAGKVDTVIRNMSVIYENENFNIKISSEAFLKKKE